MAQEQTIELKAGDVLVVVARAPLVLQNRILKKRGRPLAKDKDKTAEATKPWLSDGMSRASWYRRQAEKK